MKDKLLELIKNSYAPYSGVHFACIVECKMEIFIVELTLKMQVLVQLYVLKGMLLMLQLVLEKKSLMHYI